MTGPYGPGKVHAAHLSTNGFFEATPKYIFQGGFQAFPANVTQKNLTPKKSKIRPQLILIFSLSVIISYKLGMQTHQDVWLFLRCSDFYYRYRRFLDTHLGALGRAETHNLCPTYDQNYEKFV